MQTQWLIPAILAGALLMATAHVLDVGAAHGIYSRQQPAALICNPSIDVGAARKHPRRCTILPPEASFSQGVNLARLRWRHWGSRHATFRGIDKGFHLPPLHLWVRGYAYRLRPDRCGGGLMLYTRVRYRLGGRSYLVKPQNCYGSD
jgi:hypothetical protein